MTDYNKEIHWNLSGAFCKFKTIMQVAVKRGFFRKYKHISVHDGVENCKWNGGRLHNGQKFDPKIKAAYESLGWGINLNFTNQIIDLNDEKGNWLLEEFHNKGNGIILVNDELRKYIRLNFPKYKLIYSITGCKDTRYPPRDEDVDFYKKKQDVYDVVIPRAFHPRWAELDKARVEILINEECLVNCPNYVKHFDEVSIRNNASEETATKEEICNIHDCRIPCDKFNTTTAKAKEKLGDLYPFDMEHHQVLQLLDMGFNTFKLRGRDEEDGGYKFYLEKYLVDYISGKNVENTDAGILKR